MKYLLSITTVLILFISCEKQRQLNVFQDYECPYYESVLGSGIDSLERARMTECKANVIVDKEVLEESMLGIWELVGYGAGFSGGIDFKCNLLLFSKNELMVRSISESIDTVYTLDWEVRENEDGIPGLYSGKVGNLRLFLGYYSSKYMFRNDTDFDGPMFLYRKID